jgi:hypothetical protein
MAYIGINAFDIKVVIGVGRLDIKYFKSVTFLSHSYRIFVVAAGVWRRRCRYDAKSL